jgi:hypothetical protein
LIQKVAKHAYRVTDDDMPQHGRLASAKTRFSSSRSALRSARPRGNTTRRSPPFGNETQGA